MFVAVQFWNRLSLGPRLALKPSAASVRIRRAELQDASDIASVLRQSFLEYEDQYTPEGFAATTPGEQQVRSRMEEGPVWIALLSKQSSAMSLAQPQWLNRTTAFCTFAE